MQVKFEKMNCRLAGGHAGNEDQIRTDVFMNPVQIPNGGKAVNILGIPVLIRTHGRGTGVVESHDVTGGGPPPPQDLPRVMKTARKFGLEILPPPGGQS